VPLIQKGGKPPAGDAHREKPVVIQTHNANSKIGSPFEVFVFFVGGLIFGIYHCISQQTNKVQCLGRVWGL
jgi:hypothetical protein